MTPKNNAKIHFLGDTFVESSYTKRIRILWSISLQIAQHWLAPKFLNLPIDSRLQIANYHGWKDPKKMQTIKLSIK